MTVFQYLQSHYEISHFQYFTLVELCNHSGADIAKKELNELYAEGRIRKREGCNEILIEFIPETTK